VLEHPPNPPNPDPPEQVLKRGEGWQKPMPRYECEVDFEVRVYSSAETGAETETPGAETAGAEADETEVDETEAEASTAAGVGGGGEGGAGELGGGGGAGGGGGGGGGRGGGEISAEGKEGVLGTSSGGACKAVASGQAVVVTLYIYI